MEKAEGSLASHKPAFYAQYRNATLAETDKQWADIGNALTVLIQNDVDFDTCWDKEEATQKVAKPSNAWIIVVVIIFVVFGLIVGYYSLNSIHKPKEKPIFGLKTFEAYYDSTMLDASEAFF
ncbi:MAG: hypothetical protein EAZ95_07920, partial [Bacteroidetes bacterium]